MSFCLDQYLYFPDDFIGSIIRFRFHWIKKLKKEFSAHSGFWNQDGDAENPIVEPSAQALRHQNMISW